LKGKILAKRAKGDTKGGVRVVETRRLRIPQQFARGARSEEGAGGGKQVRIRIYYKNMFSSRVFM